MKLNFINKLSHLKTAGIKKILVVELFQDSLSFTLLLRKEKLYNIYNQTLLENIKVVSVQKIKYDNDLNSIHDLLLPYLNNNKLNNIHILIGINDCLYQKVNIPNDVEDDELWFIENGDKFMPEGRPVNEFILSSQEIKVDEYSRCYLTAVARKDYIDRIIQAFSYPEFEVIGIMPFLSSFVLNNEIQNTNRLLLIFLRNKLQYAFVSESGIFEMGEIYYNNTGNSNDLEETLLSSMYTLDQMLIKGDKPLDNLTILISAPTAMEGQIRRLLSDNLSVRIDYYSSKIESESIPAALAMTSLYNNFESCINFLPDNISVSAEAKIEKRIFLNSVFVCGAFILMLLLFYNLFSLYSRNAQSERTEETLTLNQQQTALKKLQEENGHLKANISMLNKLKDKKNTYSNLLLVLTKLTDEDCCLTGVNINSKNNYMNLDITGIAYDQTNVSDIIRKMESINEFKNVALEYSLSVNTDELSLAVKLKAKRVVRFNIKSEYNAN